MSGFRFTRPTLCTVVVLAAATPVFAQYDRDGRYVPSPMGVPADPYARTVPMYPGTPGRVIGTPNPPPAPPRLEVPRTGERLDTTTGTYSQPLVPLTIEQCKDGWTVATGVPKVEFNRRCRRMQVKKQAP